MEESGCMKEEKVADMVGENKKKYQLRKAAGIYWLMDMEQEGIPYRKPIPVNDTGADIWTLHEAGKSKDEIAESEKKAAMVSNLLVVLCGNKDAQPVVNSGSIS